MKERSSKKFVGFVVAAVMAFGMMVAPVKALAVGTVTEGTDGIGIYRVTSTKNKSLDMIGLTKKGLKKATLAIGKKITATGANSGDYMVTKVKKNTFKGAKAKKVVLPNTVTKIEKQAFNGQKAKKLTIKLKTKTFKKASVKGMLKGAKAKTVILQLPKSKKAAYKKIFTKKNLGFKGTLKIKWVKG